MGEGREIKLRAHPSLPANVHKRVFLTRLYRAWEMSELARAASTTTGVAEWDGGAQTGDETHAENYDAAQLAVRVREIDRRREHTSTM